MPFAPMLGDHDQIEQLGNAFGAAGGVPTSGGDGSVAFAQFDLLDERLFNRRGDGWKIG